VTGLRFDPEDSEVQANRLAEALEALDRGEPPELDPREDPDLASLVGAAQRLRRAGELVEARPSYVRRSREMLQHRLERRTRRSLWRRAWPTTMSAAAAALLVITVVSLAGGGSEPPLQMSVVPVADTVEEPTRPSSLAESSPAQPSADEPSELDQVPNATVLSVAEDLRRMRDAVFGIEASISRGEPVERRLLEDAAVGAARVAIRIKDDPKSLDGEMVLVYVQAASAAREALRSVTIAEGGEAALAAARIAADDGVVTAARFFGENPDALPRSTVSTPVEPAPASD
jgi:hypothetical protein